MPSVGLFTPFNPTLGTGGVQTFVHELATNMVKEGWDAFLFTENLSIRSFFTHLERIQNICGYTLYELGNFPCPITLRIKGYAEYLTENWSSFRLDLDLLFGVQMWSYGAACVKKISRTPMISYFFTTISDESASEIIGPMIHPKDIIRKFNVLFFGQVLSSFERYSALASDRVFASSFYTANSLIRMGIKKSHIETIPSGVNTTKFSPKVDGETIRARYGIKEDEYLILFVGRLNSPRKGLPYLLLALARLVKFHKIKTLVVGGGYCSTYLKKLSKALKLNNVVIFCGEIPHNELPNFFAACDLFVLPSLQEGLGIAILEAMASEKPVVATRTSGILDVVKNNETGLLVDPADPEQLAKAIVHVISDKGLAKKLGKGGRKEAERKYSWTVITKRFLSVYDQIAK